MMATKTTKKAAASSQVASLAKSKNSQKTLPTTQKIVKNSKGKHLVVDIHCHYLNPEVNAKTAHLNAPSYDPTVIYANDITNQTNILQMKTRAPKLMGIEERLQDMDKMGVDIQAVAPAPYHY
jgi:aminocarboxymuconate-semialdehyde decarboxylase